MQFDFTNMGYTYGAMSEAEEKGQSTASHIESMAEFITGGIPPTPDPDAPLPDPEYEPAAPATYIPPSAPAETPPDPEPSQGLNTMLVVGAAVVVGLFAYKVLL